MFFLCKHDRQQARVLIHHHSDEQTGDGPAALSDAKRLGILMTSKSNYQDPHHFHYKLIGTMEE
jgi:hypothetical protein